VVQLRNPVVTAIEGLVAGGFVGLGGIQWTHGTSEGITSDDVVNVATWNTGIDDRVRSLNCKRDAVQSKGSLARSARSEMYENAKDEESKEWPGTLLVPGLVACHSIYSK